ncbi:MAG: bifunctional oligoribonuclease/PAP phosphatase NrnA [Lachnospiraceae bacterium]|nr:bifunctional oligoribonuclease/PAP phosphatase NrnA [Candidatus Colinaster scatohippi]
MEKILEEVEGAKSIGISGHTKPDGDCVGACMAMYMYLRKVMPEDTVIDVILEKPADIFNCIKDIEVIREYPRRQAYDVFIALDTTPDRMGSANVGYEKAHKTINVDHHLSNPGGSDVDYIYPNASSASELVFDVIEEADIDVDIAMAIYIGIIHDTGVMQYSNTSPKTLNTVAKLIPYGFDFTTLIDATFYQKTAVQNRLLGRVLLDSKLYEEGRIVVGGVSMELFKEFGADTNDTSGIVNQLRYTRNCEVAVFLYEKEPNTWKASLRANTDVNLALVAETFGGGGHAKASGCILEGTFDEVSGRITSEIAKNIG